MGVAVAGSAMIVMHATVPVDPEHREEAIELASELAATSREEDGVVDYRVGVDIDDGNTLRFFEQYEGEDAVDSHMNSDHFQSFQAEAAELMAGEPTLVQFEVDSATDLM